MTEIKPDYDLIRKWEAALRSGAYKQMRGALKAKSKSAQGFNYCCLGVLCDVDGLEGEVRDIATKVIGEACSVDGDTLDAVFYDSGNGPNEMNDATMLPQSLRHRLPLDCLDDDMADVRLRVPKRIRDEHSTRLPELTARNETWHLATELNDDVCLNFDEIAECIRFTWPEVFAE